MQNNTTYCRLKYFTIPEDTLLVSHNSPSWKCYLVVLLAGNPLKPLCTGTTSLAWQPDSHSSLRSLDTCLYGKKNSFWHPVKVKHNLFRKWTSSPKITTGGLITIILRIITYGLGVVIECFSVILLDIKSIALLFEALRFPVQKWAQRHKTRLDAKFRKQSLRGTELRRQRDHMWWSPDHRLKREVLNFCVCKSSSSVL